MNNPTTPPAGGRAPATREEMLTALFANMIIQQANMAMMLLGKVAHPETGEFMKDVESAQMFIDQLEMMEAKTKGNLSKQEDGLLKQALGALRMAYVEAVNAPEGQAQPELEHAGPATATEPAVTAESPKAAAPVEAPVAVEESRKKFSKKY